MEEDNNEEKVNKEEDDDEDKEPKNGNHEEEEDKEPKNRDHEEDEDKEPKNGDHEEEEEKKEVVIEEIKDLKDIKEGELLVKPTPEESVPNTETSPVKPLEKSIDKATKPVRTINVDEYLVKFKNFSYLHCQWLTEEELTRGDKRINQKIKRFQQKREKSGNVLDFCDEEPFNPDYVEVDRVLDSSEHTDPATNVRH